MKKQWIDKAYKRESRLFSCVCVAKKKKKKKMKKRKKRNGKREKRRGRGEDQGYFVQGMN